jgi:uncharacterized sporulation protein YeaH/YhbH (DUF444 family)
MLELGPRELLTFATVLSGLGATYGVVRTQLSSAHRTISKLSSQLISLETRTDQVENAQAVKQNQLHTIASILSPSNLKQEAERTGAVDERLRNLEREVKVLRDLHNGRHMRTDS